METSISYKVLLGRIRTKLSKRTKKPTNNSNGKPYFDVVSLDAVMEDITEVMDKEYARQLKLKR